jgi:hypothetical protein
MSNDSVERVCEVCNQEIPKWKSKGTTVCSVGCRFERRERKRKEANAKRKPIKAKRSGVLFHDCVFGGGGGIDPFMPERCKCKKMVSEEWAKSLIARGEALDFETRTPAFTGGSIVQIGKLLRTPRSATIERPHLERLTETASAIKAKSKYSEMQLRAMHDAVELEKREKAREESMRMEIYGELTEAARQAWIVEIPADEYDAAKRRDWGRALFTNYKEGRTQGGIGIDVRAD